MNTDNHLEQRNDPIAEQHWAVAMAETVCIPGCTCIFCTRRSDADAEEDRTRTTLKSRPRRHTRRSLPSTSSVIGVLYPLSYLGTPSSFLEPPLYSPNAQGNQRERTERERTPQVSLMTTTSGALVPSADHDPLVEPLSQTIAPSLMGPSGRAPPTEPNAPVVGLDIDALEEAEPPPAYSRFDESHPRLPAASDVLGPYPHMSAVLQVSPPAR